MNLHTPQRIQGESFADYADRRKASQRLAAAITGANLTPGKNTGRENLRAAQKANGKFKAGTYGAGLIAAQTKRNRAALRAA